MSKSKFFFRRTLLIFLITILLAALAHFIIFPQETRSILIDFSNYKKQGRIYFSGNTSQSSVDTLKSLIKQASIRVNEFWGQKTCNPKFIYCDESSDFKKYSVSPEAPAATYVKLSSIIVLGRDAIDVDIIAHEISHAELYERIGFYKFMFKIPAWFKHGLAMQNDYRSYYSEDTLKVKSNDFQSLPDVNDLKTDAQFYSGSLEKVMLHYMVAKLYVKNWYTKEKLVKLISDLNAGKSFEDAFNK